MSDVAAPPFTPAAPVKIVLERRVRPGSEVAFQLWSERFVDVVSRFPGHEGTSVLAMPHRESQLVLVRFASAHALERWQRSDDFAALTREADALGPAGDFSEVKTGMETWFTLPDLPRPAKAPPRWKMAVMTWTALFPMVVVLGYLLGPLPLPPLLKQVAGTAVPVVMLTWVIMPRLTRHLYRWLYASQTGT